MQGADSILKQTPKIREIMFQKVFVIQLTNSTTEFLVPETTQTSTKHNPRHLQGILPKKNNNCQSPVRNVRSMQGQPGYCDRESDVPRRVRRSNWATEPSRLCNVWSNVDEPGNQEQTL